MGLEEDLLKAYISISASTFVYLISFNIKFYMKGSEVKIETIKNIKIVRKFDFQALDISKPSLRH